MKKISFLVAIIIVSLSGLSFRSDKGRTSSPEEFRSFLGMTYGDLVDKSLQIFGEPTQIDKHDDQYVFYTHYYKVNNSGVLTIRYYKQSRKIYVVHLKDDAGITNALDFLKSHKVNDPKMYFLGKDVKEILKTYGKPASKNSGNYEYDISDFKVDFICYNFKDKKCSEIIIYWFER